MSAKGRTTLTAREVESAKPRTTAYRLHDAKVPGLSLRVLPSGVKSWNVTWARNRDLAIGKWPVVTVEAARTKARAKLAEADQHGAPLAVIEAKKPKVFTLREFVDLEFRPWASANRKWGEGSADRILSVFRDYAESPLSELNPLTLEKWRARRVKSGTSQNTCNRDLATLKSALKRALEWGLIDVDQLRAVKQARVDSTRVRYLEPDEDKRLRKALADRDEAARQGRASNNAWREARGHELLPTLGHDDFGDHLTPAVLLSLNTGLRRGELTALEWSDIDFRANLLTVRAAAAKSGSMRRVNLNAEAVAVLRRWHRQTGGAGRLFPVRDFKTAWSRLLTDAKIDGFRWHDLRHTFASRLAQANVSLNKIRELMGHADLKMTLRYAHLASEDLADAVALISGPQRVLVKA